MGGGGGGGMSMSLVPRMRTIMTTTQRQIMEPRFQDPLYEAADFWTNSKIHSTTFKIDGDSKQVEFTFAPPGWIDSLVEGERYGIYFGDMMFLNADLLQKHPKWIPFVVAKLYGERYVDDGMDPSGLQAHYEALFRTIRLANHIMETKELVEYLQALQNHERTGYFEWDEAAKRFLEGYDSVAEAKRAYLVSHHGNKWVRMGRTSEALAAIDERYTAGFRNHAEAVATLIDSSNPKALYDAAVLVRALNQLPFDRDPGLIVVSSGMSAVAYLLTREGNGVTDLLRFVDNHKLIVGDRENVVRRLGGRRKATWLALAKRLSFNVMQLEGTVQRLMESHRSQLDQLVIDFEVTNDAATRQIELAHSLVSTRPELATELFDTLRTAYPDRVAAMERQSRRFAENLNALKDLEQLLGSAI